MPIASLSLFLSLSLSFSLFSLPSAPFQGFSVKLQPLLNKGRYGSVTRFYRRIEFQSQRGGGGGAVGGGLGNHYPHGESVGRQPPRGTQWQEEEVGGQTGGRKDLGRV